MEKESKYIPRTAEDIRIGKIAAGKPMYLWRL